jgi:hypothetical protein
MAVLEFAPRTQGIQDWQSWTDKIARKFKVTKFFGLNNFGADVLLARAPPVGAKQPIDRHIRSASRNIADLIGHPPVRAPGCAGARKGEIR